jgi:gliding motility-associated-like protein
MRIFILAVLSFSLTGLFAQSTRCSFQTPHQADNWLFFQNVGLEFTDAGATVNHPSIENLAAGKGTAAISDENGNLLFYTDGIKVWNGNHEVINAGPNLSGDLGSTQSALIIPRPGSVKDYYIFTTDLVYPPAFGYTRGFNYSRVDVSLNDNQGEVTSERDIQLLAESAEMISGVKHANGTDYWAVTHGLNGNSFHAFQVDSAGVNQTAVVSSIGMPIDGDYNKREYLGAMKLSPKGDKIAYASFGKGVVEVFSFDNNTGLVSNQITISPALINPDRGPYYVEFSPDGTKLYYTIANLSTGLDNQLYQYDILSGESVLLNTAPLDADVSALQLARDGKIYVSRYQKNMLGVIKNPNRPGLSCNYDQDGLNLGSKKTLNGLPNFVQSYFDIPAIDYDTKCLGDETLFTILNASNIDSVKWDFGDGTLSKDFNPFHVFSAPGQYFVTLTETFDDEDFQTTIPVLINPLPPKSFEAKGDSMYLFPGSRVPLDAGEGMFAYEWQDGSNGQIFEVDKGGDISVRIEDMNCCHNDNAIKVISLDIALPTAFTPNDDGLNDTFFAFGPSDGIENFNLKIFNVWGEKIWETNNFTEKWDGSRNGQAAVPGMYLWSLSFDIIGDVNDLGTIKYHNSVTLIR